MTAAPTIGAAPDNSDPVRESATATARAPGKLILMGEHSVVYGEPALVAALGLYLDVRIEPATRPATVEVRLPAYAHAESTDWPTLRAIADREARRWNAFDRDPAAAPFSSLAAEGGPDRLVRIALGEAVRRAGAIPPGARIEISGDLPPGAGFGSSAALAVALLWAFRAAFGTGWTDADLEAAALEVERRQHGHPSGVDGAAVLRGGVVWAERSPDGELSVSRARPDPSHLARFRVVDTGAPSDSTGAVVDAVRARVEREGPHARARLARMGATTREFRRVIEGAGAAADAVRLIRAYQADLTGLGVVPPRVGELVAVVEREGGAAKISGAGALAGGADATAGAGSVLVYHGDPDWLGGWTPPPGARPVEAPLGVAGVGTVP